MSSQFVYIILIQNTFQQEEKLNLKAELSKNLFFYLKSPNIVDPDFYPTDSLAPGTQVACLFHNIVWKSKQQNMYWNNWHWKKRDHTVWWISSVRLWNFSDSRSQKARFLAKNQRRYSKETTVCTLWIQVLSVFNKCQNLTFKMIFYTSFKSFWFLKLRIHNCLGGHFLSK